ncbi:MAG: Holliday junction branch migration DNA helicase RuvB [Rickettsia sp.]|nr:Holliday junction branch migration DNA helicase RuvB [Rickettsia sp.]
MKNPLLIKEELVSDEETTLRPNFLKEFLGQNKVKKNLSIFIEAAKKRKEHLDHTIFFSPPGLGKTSLANIIAKELNVNIKSTSGPILSKASDIASILTNLKTNDVLFIDEIHRLNSNLEEMLYSAMEDFQIDIMIGEGPAAKSIKIDLAKFTLVGATTRLGLLSNPFKDRFAIQLRLDFYSISELQQIIFRIAKILNSKITEVASKEIANKSRFTPRIAIRIFKRVRDFALVHNKDIIDQEITNYALEELEIEKLGLDSNDLRYLKYIYKYYNGGPVGIETIASALSEDKDSLEETIEPFLIQIGFIQKSSKGRNLTMSGKEFCTEKFS